MSEIYNADVQYNDVKGTAALDFHGSLSELFDYAKSKGIDTNKYEPVGIDVYCGETGFFSLSFYVIDKEKSEEYEQSNAGRLPVIEIRVDETWKEFERRFKRLNLRLFLSQRNLDLINSVEVDEL